MSGSAEIPPAAQLEGISRHGGRRIEKVVIHAFACFHIAAITCWSLSSPESTAPLNQRVRSRLAPYVMTFGFWQQWNMFAPNPPLSNNYLEAEVTYSDGVRTNWRFPSVDQMVYFERYRKERYRKWATERVIAGGNPSPVVAEAAARFAARQARSDGTPPQRVELVRFRSQIPAPRRGRLPAHSEAPGDWVRQVLYTCEFDEKGRIVRAWAATQPASTRPAEGAGPGRPGEQSPSAGTPGPGPAEKDSSRDGGDE